MIWIMNKLTDDINYGLISGGAVEKWFAFFMLPFILAGCDIAGGGGSDPYEPASVSVDVSPYAIDSGDNTTVTVDYWKNTDDDFVIKVRYPVNIKYVLDSSTLEVKGKVLDAGPDVAFQDEESGYLAYFIDRSKAPRASQGKLTFVMQGLTDLQTGGKVEVDVDLDDPDVPDKEEFSSTEIKFTAQEYDDIRVGPAPTTTIKSK